MSETLKKLHEIGIDAIHAKTHISIHSLKAILEERFEDISHIQYTGFLSIMEPDLHMDMSELRQSYQNFREETGKDSDNRELFISTPKEAKKYKALILSTLSIILIVLFISTMSSKKESLEEVETLTQNSAIKDAAKHLETAINTDIERARTTKKIPSFDATQVNEDETKAKETHPFVLYPQEALWIGVVNLDTDEQKDTITSAPFVLDENANLLISLGHGMVRIELNGDVQKLSDVGRVRFSYRNGELNRVSLSQFIDLNKGKSW